MRASLQRIRVADPLGPTLAIMGRTAHEAARTWTLQEHVGRLATTAGPRDYLGQLRALYDDFCEHRWRYTMEPGERVPGTARALLGHVFGAGYNQGPDCPSPEHCAPSRQRWQRGFGDCDDASSFIAAGALALGMTPTFRVVRWPGGAHVSTVVETPRGERVSVDPVGYPEHPFGWAASPPGANVQEYDLEGREHRGGGQMDGFGAAPAITKTWYSGPKRGIRVGRRRPHVVLVASNDDRGARVLAMPLWAQRVFKRGLVVPQTRAYDQFGELYSYVAGLDAWAPIGYPAHPPIPETQAYSDEGQPLGGRAERRARRKARRARRRARRKKRWQNFKKKVKGFFVKVRKGLARVLRKISQSKIAKFFRKVKSKILKNKLVQGAISTVLSAFGVPRKATQAVMEREAALADRGGRSTLAALVAEGKWGQAAKMVAGSFVDAGKAVLKNLIPGASAIASKVGLSGYEGLALAGLPESTGCRWVMEQGGRAYHVAPVAAMTGVSGVYLAGQLEVSETPESGRWYRIQPGDTLLTVVGDAFDLPAGGARLKAAQWVNAAAANQCLHTTDISDTEKKWFGGSRISFKPKFACSREAQERCSSGDCYGIIWLAPAANIEPPEEPDEPIPDEPEPEPLPEPEPEPDDPEEPDTPVEEPPPGPPDDDDDEPDPPVDVPDEPEPEPDTPPAPPDPDEPDPVEPVPDEPPAEPDDPEPEPEPEPEPAPEPDPEPVPATFNRGRLGMGLAVLLALASGGR